MNQVETSQATPRWQSAVIILLLLAAVMVRVGFVVKHRQQLTADPDKYVQMAENVAQFRVLGRKLVAQWDVGQPSPVLPSAYRPPMYPLVLAVTTQIGSSPLAIALLHVVLGVGAVLMVWRLGVDWQLGLLAPLAAFAMACDPVLLQQSALAMPATLETTMASACLLVLTCWSRRQSTWLAILAGAILGLSVHCRSVFLVYLCIVVLLASASLTRHRRWHAICIVLAASVVLAPWAARNLMALGHPILTTTSGGYSLLRANNGPWYDHLQGDDPAPWEAESVYQQLDEQLAPESIYDEVARDALAYQLALQAIIARPTMFLWSCGHRMTRFWSVSSPSIQQSPETSRPNPSYLIAAWYTVLWVLALAGLWRTRHRLWKEPWLWATLLLLSVTAVHLLYWSEPRLRAPVMPVIYLLAAAAVARTSGGAIQARGVSK